MHRKHQSAPSSTVPAERRGRVVGRFCRSCRSIYPLFAAWHRGKPAVGRDHVGSPCSQEGRRFVAEAPWWEPAVELSPEAHSDAAEPDAAS
jgi:hypothetical protein